MLLGLILLCLLAAIGIIATSPDLKESIAKFLIIWAASQRAARVAGTLAAASKANEVDKFLQKPETVFTAEEVVN